MSNNYVRIAIIIVCVIALWYLVTALARGVAQESGSLGSPLPASEPASEIAALEGSSETGTGLLLREIPGAG